MVCFRTAVFTVFRFSLRAQSPDVHPCNTQTPCWNRVDLVFTVVFSIYCPQTGVSRTWTCVCAVSVAETEYEYIWLCEVQQMSISSAGLMARLVIGCIHDRSGSLLKESTGSCSHMRQETCIKFHRPFCGITKYFFETLYPIWNEVIMQ